MTTAELTPLHDLYEHDETAWLEALADLSHQRDLSGLDLDILRAGKFETLDGSPDPCWTGLETRPTSHSRPRGV